MRPLEAANDARCRLEMQLREFGISAKFTDEIIGHHMMVNYNKGSMIFLEGSPGDFFFWIFAGLAKVYCPRSDGTRILVKLAGPGDLVGHVDSIDSKGHRTQAFEVQTLTKCSVAIYTREHVTKLLRSLDPAILIQVIEQLNTAWSSMARWFGTFLGMSFQERLEVVLKELGARFGVREKRGILLVPELAHSDLADMIGSSRPMVSRLIAEMTKEGLLLRQGKQFILVAEEKSDSTNQWEELNGSRVSSESSPMTRVDRPLSNHCVTGGDDKMRIGRASPPYTTKPTRKGVLIRPGAMIE